MLIFSRSLLVAINGGHKCRFAGYINIKLLIMCFKGSPTKMKNPLILGKEQTWELRLIEMEERQQQNESSSPKYLKHLICSLT